VPLGSKQYQLNNCSLTDNSVGVSAWDSYGKISASSITGNLFGLGFQDCWVEIVDTRVLQNETGIGIYDGGAQVNRSLVSGNTGTGIDVATFAGVELYNSIVSYKW
jgi:Right handed beta helix region